MVVTFVSTGLAIAGVLAASIPIIIHLLLRRRRRPVEWAAFDLLREAMRRHRRRSRIERLLLLAVRAILLAMLGAALAQPLLGERSIMVGPRTLHVVLDDGIVSGVADEDGRTALERHIAEVRTTISALASADRVGVVLAGRPVRALVDPPTADHDAVIRAIDGLPAREGGTDLVAALDLVADSTDAPGVHEILVASDFRAGSVDESARPPAILGSSTVDAPRLRATAPVSDDASSVRVADLEIARAPWSLAASETTRLVRVDLRRSGDAPAATSTLRIIGDAVIAEESRTIDWAAGVREATVELQVGVDDDGGELVASIETAGGADDLSLDDARRTMVAGRRPTRVVVLDRDEFGGAGRLDRWRGADWFARALRPTEDGPLADAIEVDRVDPATVDERDLIDAGLVVVGRPDLASDEFMAALADWTRRGGVAVVLPPGAETVRPWTAPLFEAMSLEWTAALEPVDLDPPRRLATDQPRSPITRLLEAELPDLAPGVSIERRLPIESTEAAARVLVDDAGDPVVLQAAVGEGRLVLFTVAPELMWTDLPVRPLMVPLVQEIVRQGAALARRGRDGEVGAAPPVVASATAASVVLPDGRRVDWPWTVEPEIDRSGIVEVLDLGERVVERRAVNPAVESALLESTSIDAVRAWLAPTGNVEFTDAVIEDAAPEIGSNLAAILVAIVLALAIFETALARWFARGGIVARRSAGLTGANADAEAASRARREVAA